MHWTRTDALRRWIVVAGLIIGPALLVLSVVVNFSPPRDSMRADFEAMTANPGIVVAEAWLETLGFMIVLAALAGSTQALRARGGALGTTGAALAMLGIVGFSQSNANGFTIAEIAALPDHDAGFATASALMSGEIAGTVGTIGLGLEMLGQLGILLVIIGLIRARIIPVWPLLMVVVGIIVNLAGGIMLTTLLADILLLATGCWIAVALARCSQRAWLGMPAVALSPTGR
jgi:hypothetical protein